MGGSTSAYQLGAGEQALVQLTALRGRDSGRGLVLVGSWSASSVRSYSRRCQLSETLPQIVKALKLLFCSEGTHRLQLWVTEQEKLGGSVPSLSPSPNPFNSLFFSYLILVKLVSLSYHYLIIILSAFFGFGDKIRKPFGFFGLIKTERFLL